MSNYDQRRPYLQSAAYKRTPFVVGERVRIIRAPESYGYNGRTGSVAAVSGATIEVVVDEHPTGMRCITFYAEELERELLPQVTNDYLGQE